MNSLAAYGSDSDSDDDVLGLVPVPNPATTSSHHHEDPDTSDYDPADAFGLGALKSSSSSSSSSSNPAATSSTSTSETTKASTSSATKPRSAGSSSTYNASRSAQPVSVPSSSASASASTSTSSSTAALALTPTPRVIDNSSASEALLLRPGDTTMHVNIPYRDMTAPQLGPENPFASNHQRRLGAQQNSLSGHVEDAAISDFDFRNQQRTFDVYGYAKDPSVLFQGRDAGADTGRREASHGGWVGDQATATRLGGASAVQLRSSGTSRAVSRALRRQRRGVDGAEGDPGVVEGQGAYVGPWARWEGDDKVTLDLDVGGGGSGGGQNPLSLGPTAAELSRAEAESAQRDSDKLAADERRRGTNGAHSAQETSIFHGKSMYDYQGRTYMHVPTDVDVNLTSDEPGDLECFLPKTCIHTFQNGHSKGVSTLELFPRSGHLLLSASMDATVKLWDLYRGGGCLRTFMGHTKAVRDVAFSNDGTRFLSASYDRKIKLWDTETGACLSSFSPGGKIPYCVTFHPDADKQNIFLTGTSEKKVLQFDTASGAVVQEYTQHLGAVNTITFVDNGRRFVSTSDDKTMRAWDYGIPVVIKYVSDPAMHSLPAVSLSPNKKWLACQSLDNHILTFASDGLKQNRKKTFQGHNVAGFACQPAFSPDGKFLSSGDSEGNLVFWDWKTTKLLKRIRGAHREPIISHAWLPHQSSKLVTGSWDGNIKLWD
ncbi:WD40 repeat-like protein [Testicularia cyperi]|uniref:Pre-mRNA-processing factor 17 n=1 Tax=Testicularia cyperi TaxID=1882483 RepID=A0A317XH96_9BASI|nr:WD40 repeat-like protein [Testicularia cyperi]